MIRFLLVLASIAPLGIAQDCPPGYESHNGSTTANQTIQWISCPVENEPNLECATLDVPLDYTDTSMGLLPLHLVRIPAESSLSNGKSIIFNPGGPGGSGVLSVISDGASLST